MSEGPYIMADELALIKRVVIYATNFNKDISLEIKMTDVNGEEVGVVRQIGSRYAFYPAQEEGDA